MNFTASVLSLLSLLFFVNESAITPTDDLFGIWVYASSLDNGSPIYHKAAAFDEKRSGIQFMEEGQLICRENSGWCGTPPIFYENYKGNWLMNADSTLMLKYDDWGGETERKVEIVFLSSEKLIIKSVNY